MTNTPLTFSEPQRSAQETTTSALLWLQRKANQPFFAWIHYMDPHAEYSPPDEFREQYPANPYDGEIAYVDQQLGRLLDGIDGVLSHTIIVLADHGEGLTTVGDSRDTPARGRTSVPIFKLQRRPMGSSSREPSLKSISCPRSCRC
jgi:membrane-anchored protein YejM (alkaline phosphatase superfamily)